MTSAPAPGRRSARRGAADTDIVLRLPGIVPGLVATPGDTARPAPALGQRICEVLSTLGCESATIDAPAARPVVKCAPPRDGVESRP